MKQEEIERIKSDCFRALQSLYIAVDSSVAHDVNKCVRDYIAILDKLASTPKVDGWISLDEFEKFGKWYEYWRTHPKLGSTLLTAYNYYKELQQLKNDDHDPKPETSGNTE